MILNKRERLFYLAHKNSTGHEAVGQPGSLAFFRNGHRSYYRPDFYCPDCRIYFEVVGSRQAFHQNRTKIEAFKLAYPDVNLKYVHPDGSEYDPNRPHRNGYPRRWMDPYPRPELGYRLKAVERLQKSMINDSHGIKRLANEIGVGRCVIRYLLAGQHLPHPKTAKLINGWFDSHMEAEQ
ncbi:MAG: hypothetical protein JW730_18315 [Anaerolineales bacterium]|nr:hypothetical protein [Anaerolineales bacterium]